MSDGVTREAVIVAHGQPSKPQPPEDHLAVLAQSVQARLPGWRIRSATIAAPGRLEAEVAEMSPSGLIYPMFMSDGYFVSRVLPGRLGDADVRILPPLGFDPDLPALAANIIDAAVADQGWLSKDSRILLAAHGSGRGDRAARAAYAFADKLRARLTMAQLSVGFIEEAPFVKDAAMGLGTRAICLPFFALEGDHCREDIPQGLEIAKFQGLRLAPLGEHAGVIDLIAKTLQSTEQGEL